MLIDFRGMPFTSGMLLDVQHRLTPYVTRLKEVEGHAGHERGPNSRTLWFAPEFHVVFSSGRASVPTKTLQVVCSERIETSDRESK